MRAKPGQALPGPYLGFQLKHIGDFLMTLPALGFIRQNRPDWPVGVVVTPKIAELAQAHPWVDEVFILDRTKGPGHLWNTARAIGRRHQYQTGLIFDGQTRSIVAAALAGLPHRAGASGLYSTGAWSFLYHYDLEIRDESWPVESQAYRGQKLAASALSLDPGPALRPPKPALGVENLEQAEALAAELKGSGPIIGLALQGMQPEKSWPLVHFAELCRRLWVWGEARLYVTGGPGESRLVKALAEASKVPVADFCGRTSLLDVVALAGKSDLYITIDTGTSHLAALTETPIISIFIWTSPALWPPQSPQARLMCYDWALARFGLRRADGPWRAAPVVTPAMVFEEALSVIKRFG